MARLAASGDKVEGSATISPAGDYSLFGWVRSDHIPGSAYNEDWWTNSSALGWHSCVWNHTDVSFQKCIAHRGGGGWYSAKTTSSLSADTWYAFGGSYNAATQDLQVWLNGVNEATTASVPNNTDSAAVMRVFHSAIGITAAWCARWNVVLAANEWLALYRGVPPWRIRPAALQVCIPLWGLHSPEIDLSANSDTAAVTGTTLANGPPVTLFTPKIVAWVEAAAGVSTRQYRLLTMGAS